MSQDVDALALQSYSGKDKSIGSKYLHIPLLLSLSQYFPTRLGFCVTFIVFCVCTIQFPETI